MKRRNFILNSILTGTAIGFLPEAFSKNLVKTQAPAGADFILEEITIDELQSKMASGELTSKKITELYLQRIAEIDKNGYQLNAVIELNPDALAIADELDQERKSGKTRSKMHGIPVLIKDNIDTADQMQTTAGSVALAGHKAQKDAGLVSRLRASGAVILGKTNLSEWANFRSSRSSSGWSSRGGQTLNPYVLDRSPCGSSSGSGTAVSANLCAVAIGTETDGSISCPSSINGIVGIKPTVGLVSRSGIIPISKSQDTAGPMARTVTDAAILLNAIAGDDSRDPSTSILKSKKIPDYTQFLDANFLKGKRIGYDPSVKRHELVDKAFSSAIGQLKTAGATLVPVAFDKQNDKLGDAEYLVLQYEFKDGLNQYLKTADASVKSLADVIKFNNEHEDSAMPWFKQEILVACEAKGNLKSKEYIDAITKMATGRKFLNDLMNKNNLDGLCITANGASWNIDLVNGDSFTGYGGYSFSAKTGFPSVTVPMGMVNGLPVGICFFGRSLDEGRLIGLAYAYEQISKNRKRPEFAKTIKYSS